MNVRLRRLQSDYEQIQKRLEHSPVIRVAKAAGNPPETYEIEYRCRGLMVREDGEIAETSPHVVEIALTRAYPHRAPHCKMLTPCFHPNINPGAICIGDHWAASESLGDLIIRIGEMICYQSYNTKSPLNPQAARWADEHRDLFPVDTVDLTPPEAPPAPAPPRVPEAEVVDAGERCENCRAPAAEAQIVRCPNGHVVCTDCLLKCERCGKTVCLLCKTRTCAICNTVGCEQCLKLCAECGRSVCPTHLATCAVCGKTGCAECVRVCSECNRPVCKKDATLCRTCSEPVCPTCAARCALCPPESAHHAGELAQCEKCGATVCPTHLRASAISGAKICDICGTPCSSCRRWVTNSEMLKCSGCNTRVCSACAKTCAVCNEPLCPSHAATCGICGHSCARYVGSKCAHLCPQCGKTVCKVKSHAGWCSVCHKLICLKCLTACCDCHKLVCSQHTIECHECDDYVCSNCVQECASCRQLRHMPHLITCAVGSEKVCKECVKTCTRCGAQTCALHMTHFSPEMELCGACFQRREKLMQRVAIGAVAGGVLLLAILIYVLAKL